VATMENDRSYREVLQGIFSEHPEALGDLVTLFLNRMLKAEQTEYLGAAPYERTDERTDYRSGSRPRMIKTRLGTLTLMVPQTRGGFVTSALERYQRSERALLSGIGEMALKGVSTRKVQDVTEAFFGFPVSAQTVSGLYKDLDDELKEWRSRGLEDAYPYLIIDARYQKVRIGHKVVSQGVLIVTGIDESGVRRTLDLMLADSESEVSWRELFNRLKKRGLHGVTLVVSDDHQGLVEAVRRCFQGASWQRCQAHFMRNAMKKVSPKERRALADALKDVFGSPDIDEAVRRADELAQEIRARKPKVADWIEGGIGDCLTVFSFPKGHRTRLRTTNMVERLNKEIKRRASVIEIFPSEQSAERIIGALLIDQDEKWQVGRTYLNMDELKEWEKKQSSEQAEELEFAETS
jgi:putative transposase